MQTCGYQLPYPLHFPTSRPIPRFCVFRPGGILVPLIPIDELPTWLEICNWNPDMYMGLQPVSMTFVPREGEYDIICHHCSSSLDSLHQSVSERNEDSPKSAGSRAQSSPRVFASLDAGALPQNLDYKVAPFRAGVPSPILAPKPFHAGLQSPFLGGLTFNMPNMPAMTISMVPMPVLSQMPSNVVDPSPPASDRSSKEPPVTSTSPPQKPSLGGLDTEDSASLLKLSPLPPPALPLEGHDSRPKTPAPIVPTKHPISPDTQCKISHAIAASLCSVSVENENRPPQSASETACQRRRSISQASNSNILLNIAPSLGSASVVNGRVASPFPLIAALDHLKEVISSKNRSRSSSRASFASSRPLSRASSRTKRRRAAAERRHAFGKRQHERANRRRERRKEKLAGRLETKSPKVEHRRSGQLTSDAGQDLFVEPKPEQVNSYTKRRDRREKMAPGHRNGSSQSRYVHMTMASNPPPNVSCH